MDIYQILTEINNLLNNSDTTPEVSLNYIKHLDDFIQFNKRLYGLNKEELDDFNSTMGGGLTKKEIDFLNEVEGETKKDYYIDMWARSNYFRQCSWMSYLHGESTDKPYIQKLK